MAFASTFFPIGAVGVVWKGRRVVDDARVGINEGRGGISEACAQVEWPAGWYQRGLCTGRVACGLVSTTPVHRSSGLRAGISEAGACIRLSCAGISRLRAHVR